MSFVRRSLRAGSGSLYAKGATGSPNGFVLLEAVVALAILGVTSVVLLQARAQQIRVAIQARELLSAQALAEDRLSAIRLLDYLGLDDPPDSLLAGAFPPPFEGFTWTASVELIDEEFDLFGVEVVVTGPAERFPLRTLVHRPGSAFVAAGAQGATGGGRAEAGARDDQGRGGPPGSGGRTGGGPRTGGESRTGGGSGTGGERGRGGG
jgi:type II secretory pathway pseudopilin PulG